MPSAPIRVLRVIARLNVGGPAYHVSILSGRMDPARYEHLLVHGKLGAGEGSFEALAEREGCVVEVVPDLAPEIRPLADLRALGRLVRIIRRFRPDIVHTHTAKAGMVGRTAALLATRRRPVVIHTYHGHVLEGYFGRLKNGVYRGIERALARFTDCLIGVSAATVDDLVRLRVAARERFRVLPIGLDLERLCEAPDGARQDLLARLEAPEDAVVLVYFGRLVPIKRVDVLLRAVGEARRQDPRIVLAVVGDGEQRSELETLASELGIAGAVSFLGYVEDIASTIAGSDIAVLSSDNEGTPVALIESAAGGRPAVATHVGGVADVVTPETGLLVPAGDWRAFAAALLRLTGDEELRQRMGEAARAHVLERYSSARLVRDMEALYLELMGRPA